MARNSESILVGAADVFISDTGADLPTLVPGTSAAVTLAGAGATGWRNAGYTTGGVEFVYAPDFGEVEVDQLLDSAKIFKQRQSVTVNTTFAQAELRNLLFAWGQPNDTLTGGGAGVDTLVGTADDPDETLVISAGALGDAPVERSLAFVGPAPGTGRERVYHLERVLSVESTSTGLNRAEASTVPVSLRCLPIENGEYGRIVDRART